jgi:hypothetical protein
VLEIASLTEKVDMNQNPGGRWRPQRYEVSILDSVSIFGCIEGPLPAIPWMEDIVD